MPNSLVTIAVDAMGGDHAPKSEVEGALRAVRHLPVEVVLVGREDVLMAELSAHHPGWDNLPIRLHHASEVVTMDDGAAKSLRNKKDSSIRVACRLMKEGLVRAEHRRVPALWSGNKIVYSGNSPKCLR